MHEFTEKSIDHIKFTLFSPEMIRKMSTVKVTVPDTYNEDGYPIDGGLMDQHMGVIDPGLRCKTCGGTVRTCPGHFGHIDLVRPVLHSEFARVVAGLLKMTCSSCSRALIKKKEKESGGLEEVLTKEEIFEEMKKAKKCPYCGAKQEDIKFEKPTTIIEGKKVLLPIEIRERLSKIPNEDLKILGLDPESARPEWMVLTALPIPPVQMRPSIILETGERSEDDLTHKLVDLIRINQRLEANLNAGAPQLIIEDLWELLQYHVTTYFNNESANIPPARHRSGRPVKTLSQRLKGKEGRFRYNLSGKRVNFSSRTVISPDPNISINEVGVPLEVAEELTIPIDVTPWNIDECKKMMQTTNYPCVVYVTDAEGRRRRLMDKNREELVNALNIGWTVERQLVDGDSVIFNRQPSLHRISMMCHKVRVLPGKTFRLHTAVCPPYNADFDGDEMNLHVPQTYEARAEAEELMLVEKNIISPRHGNPLIIPNEDHTSGIYLLTRKSTKLTVDEASHLLGAVGIYEIPKPNSDGTCSGKDVFSVLLPKDFDLEMKGKLCREVNECSKQKCPYEGYVVIKDGSLKYGAIDSKVVSAIVEKLFHNYGSEVARTFIDRITKMSVNMITIHGFSVGLDNYHVDKKTKEKIDEIRENAAKEVEALILKYKNKTLHRMPGKSLTETLETSIMNILSKARDSAGPVIRDYLGHENTSILMANVGSRGSILNAIQMAACLGQQAVRGKRITRGYRRRVLPHFKKNDMGAYARGFIKSSFIDGISPVEYFFHAIGGRESVVNTSIRTARSGYMQRRLINALQDLYVDYDLTVKDSDGNLIQVRYGGDGIDPMRAKAER
ncbi:MAG: DNA-directed RNA polymerase subunit A' [Candidatus Micrarchaeia archaeon]